jgi:hypothetical protein
VTGVSTLCRSRGLSPQQARNRMLVSPPRDRESRGWDRPFRGSLLHLALPGWSTRVPAPFAARNNTEGRWAKKGIDHAEPRVRCWLSPPAPATTASVVALQPLVSLPNGRIQQINATKTPSTNGVSLTISVRPRTSDAAGV